MLQMMILRKVLHDRHVLEKGGSDKQAKIANQMERERQARMQEAIAAIRDIFADAGRDALYDQQEQAVYDLNAKSVNDQYEQAERNNRFGLARNGLMGGSAEVDSNADLQKITNEGLVQAKALGQQAGGQLRSSDESAKQNLISLAESGMDSSTAANLAQSQMATNMQNALGQRGASAISGLFDGLMAGYLNNRVLDAYQQGYNFGNQRNYGSTGSTSNTYGGTTSKG